MVSLYPAGVLEGQLFDYFYADAASTGFKTKLRVTHIDRLSPANLPVALFHSCNYLAALRLLLSRESGAANVARFCQTHGSVFNVEMVKNEYTELVESRPRSRFQGHHVFASVSTPVDLRELLQARADPELEDTDETVCWIYNYQGRTRTDSLADFVRQMRRLMEDADNGITYKQWNEDLNMRVDPELYTHLFFIYHLRMCCQQLLLAEDGTGALQVDHIGQVADEISQFHQKHVQDGNRPTHGEICGLLSFLELNWPLIERDEHSGTLRSRLRDLDWRAARLWATDGAQAAPAASAVGEDICSWKHAVCPQKAPGLRQRTLQKPVNATQLLELLRRETPSFHADAASGQTLAEIVRSYSSQLQDRFRPVDARQLCFALRRTAVGAGTIYSVYKRLYHKSIIDVVDPKNDQFDLSTALTFLFTSVQTGSAVSAFFVRRGPDQGASRVVLVANVDPPEERRWLEWIKGARASQDMRQGTYSVLCGHQSEVLVDYDRATAVLERLLRGKDMHRFDGVSFAVQPEDAREEHEFETEATTLVLLVHAFLACYFERQDYHEQIPGAPVKETKKLIKSACSQLDWMAANRALTSSFRARVDQLTPLLFQIARNMHSSLHMFPESTQTPDLQASVKQMNSKLMDLLESGSMPTKCTSIPL